MSFIRDYCHVVDLAKGHVHCMKVMFGQNSNKVWAYNLGTGRCKTKMQHNNETKQLKYVNPLVADFSVLDVIKEFEAATGKKVAYDIVERRVGDVPSTYSTAALVEKELGWKANLTMKDMCKKSMVATGDGSAYLTIEFFRFRHVDVAAEEPQGLQPKG